MQAEAKRKEMAAIRKAQEEAEEKEELERRIRKAKMEAARKAAEHMKNVDCPEENKDEFQKNVQRKFQKDLVQTHLNTMRALKKLKKINAKRRKAQLKLKRKVADMQSPKKGLIRCITFKSVLRQMKAKRFPHRGGYQWRVWKKNAKGMWGSAETKEELAAKIWDKHGRDWTLYVQHYTGEAPDPMDEDASA